MAGTPVYDFAYDDGFYAGLDYAIYGEYYIPQYFAPTFAPSRLAVVPEPATLTLLGMFTVIGVCRRSR